MPRLAVLALGAVLSGSCSKIVVRDDDPSPPVLRVILVNASAINAAYSDGTMEAIRGQIDTSRPFHVTARRDRHRIDLVFIAVDPESGISTLRASLAASFRCATRVAPAGPVLREAATTFRGVSRSPTPADPGDRVPDHRSVSVGFTLEDLWRQGGCTTWGDFTGVNSGMLSNIRVQYSATATNKARRAGTESLTGRFTVTDGAVADDDGDGIADAIDTCPYHQAPAPVSRLVGRFECASRNEPNTDFLGLPSLPVRIDGFGETQTDCEGNFALPVTDGRSLSNQPVNLKFWYDANVPGPGRLSTRLRVTDEILNAWGTNDVVHHGYDRTVDATVSRSPTGEQVLTAPTVQLSSSECEIWRAGTIIATDYQEAVGTPIQGGTLQYMRRPGRFDTGPFTFYDYVDLHEGFIDQRPVRETRENTLFHETGHIIRDYADGGRSHWDGDMVRYVYARCHVGTEIREQGYAFHEGWATYWAQARHRAHNLINPATTNYCDGNVGPRGVPLTDAHVDWVENMIADRLLMLAACVGNGDLDQGDRILVETLRANPGTIHSMFEFETALGCTRACCDTRPAPQRCPPGYEDHGTCIGFGGHNVRYD